MVSVLVPLDKYPPAEPGALGIGPLEAAVLLLLVSDVLPYHRFVPTYGRDEVPSRPKVLPYKIAFLLSVYTGQMDRTFTLDEPDHLRNRVFWRNRNHHVNVIRHQMTFFDPAFLLLCQLAKYIPEVPPQLPVKRLPAALGNEHNMIFALPLAVA